MLEHYETVAVDARRYILQSKQLCKHIPYQEGEGIVYLKGGLGKRGRE